MFERDKEELRELGVPLETGTEQRTSHDDEPGYRIARRDYELPEIVLEPDEAAALGLAARLWQSAPLAGATGSGAAQAAGRRASTPGAAPAALEPRVGASEPAFEGCLARRPRRPGGRVRLPHGRRGRARSERRVEPWGVVSWRGRWYLVGHDTDRGAARVFRLSRDRRRRSRRSGRRAPSSPPDGVDLRAHGRPDGGRRAARRPPACALRPGAGWELRREATATRRRPRPRRLDRRRRRLLRPRALRRPGHRLRRRRRRAVARRRRATPSCAACAALRRRERRVSGRRRSCPGCSRSCRTCSPGPACASARSPRSSASPRSGCARTSTCCGCAGCRATARATSSTSSSRATRSPSSSRPASPGRCG